nr:hypothetical protein CFP56_00992 [Quercus suber]
MHLHFCRSRPRESSGARWRQTRQNTWFYPRRSWPSGVPALTAFAATSSRGGYIEAHSRRDRPVCVRARRTTVPDRRVLPSESIIPGCENIRWRYVRSILGSPRRMWCSQLQSLPCPLFVETIAVVYVTRRGVAWPQGRGGLERTTCQDCWSPEWLRISYDKLNDPSYVHILCWPRGSETARSSGRQRPAVRKTQVGEVDENEVLQDAGGQRPRRSWCLLRSHF